MTETLDRNYYLVRAASARRRATQATDEEMRVNLEALARSYDRLAEETALNMALCRIVEQSTDFKPD